MAGLVLTVRHPGAIALIPASIVATVLAFFISSGSWQALGIWPEPSIIGGTTGFADLANQTATADCLRFGKDVTTCDPYGRPFTPYAVLPASILAAVNLGVSETGLLGVGLAFLYVITIWFLARTIARVASWMLSFWRSQSRDSPLSVPTAPSHPSSAAPARWPCSSPSF